MIESTLVTSYGMPGIFIAYLIYDRQVMLKKLIIAIDRLTEKLEKE